MRHKRSLLLLVAAMLAASSLVIASPAGAIANACTVNEFGNLPAGQSELKVNCTLTSASASVGLWNKVEDFSSGTGATGVAEAVWHVGAGRKVVTTAATVAPSKVITAGAGHFAASDVNSVITGTGVPARAFIVAVTATTATLNVATAGGGIASGTTLVVENGDGRSVTDATFSTTTITSTTAHFCKPALGNCGTHTDIGRHITGTQIPHGATITAVASATSATLSAASTACPAGVTNCGTVSIQPAPTTTTQRYVSDVTVSGASLCSATAKFNTTDVNLPVSGANVGTFTKWITAVTPAGGAPCVAGQSKATLNVAGTNGANQVIVIGQPNATAPANNDAVSQLGAELALSPSLVAGSPACSTNVATGFAIQGKWLNPDAFVAAAFGAPNTATLPKAPVIAELLFPTAAGLSFAAFVQPIPASTSGETATAPHYDITFPLLPTALAMCASPSAVGVGADFRFNAVSASQGLLLTGTGMPSTAQIRALQDLPVGVATRSTSASFVIRQSNGTTPVFSATSTCVENYPGVIDFHCGS